MTPYEALSVLVDLVNRAPKNNIEQLAASTATKILEGIVSQPEPTADQIQIEATEAAMPTDAKKPVL